MPLNVRRYSTSVLLALSCFAALISAQTTTTPQAVASPVQAPTTADVMRDRISKAKAYIAVRNYSAAIFELETIRRETNDPSVNAVANVLLMNSYLEQGDYKRAQEFLTEFFTAIKSNRPNAATNYFAVAGQVVKGARNRVERYRVLGLNISDRDLPLEAVNDIEQMRESLELVVAQSKELGKDKSKTQTAMALLEEAGNSRSMMARDDYDARRWRDEVSDAREFIASSRSVVINASSDLPPDNLPTVDLIMQKAPTAAPANVQPIANTPATSQPDTPVFKPVTETPVRKVEPEKTAETRPEEKPRRMRVNEPEPTKKDETKQQPIVASTPADTDGPLQVGSLIDYATNKAAPVYPAAARVMRATGLVKLEVIVNEEGEVTEVQKASGHSILQSAAKDAIKKWRFRPFLRDGQPVKAAGFVNFNFTL